VHAQPAGVLDSVFSPVDVALDPTPSRAEWAGVEPVLLDHDYLSTPISGRPTQVRSRWTHQYLYLLYTCPYDTLNLKPDPNVRDETPRLWAWDVAEAFVGWDLNRITSYKELQVSPQGEWVDLDIDRANPGTQAGMAWQSGFTVRTRIDADARVWYGLMQIPWAAIDPRPPEPGRELRLGLYRIAGAEPSKQYYAWRPTGQKNFHVPEAFGTLRLR